MPYGDLCRDCNRLFFFFVFFIFFSLFQLAPSLELGLGRFGLQELGLVSGGVCLTVIIYYYQLKRLSKDTPPRCREELQNF